MAKEKRPCKTCEEKMEDGFIESIQEEIRNENWQILWNKYGKLITYASVALVLGTAIYSVWQRQDIANKEAISSRFSVVQSMLMSGDVEKAIPQIRELANVSKKDYAVLAKLEYAAVLRDKNDKEALIQYKSIFEDKKVSVIIRDLAYIYYVNSSIDLMDLKDISLNLAEFIENLSTKYVKGPWALIAKETLSFCYIKAGENDKAKEILESIVKTNGVPADMSERAKILLQAISA